MLYKLGGAATESDGKVSETVSSMTQVSGPTTLPRLSEQLGLEELWNTLGNCLAELARTPDHHAVLILQPAVEAFFIVHAGEYLNVVIRNVKLFGFHQRI